MFRLLFQTVSDEIVNANQTPSMEYSWDIILGSILNWVETKHSACIQSIGMDFYHLLLIISDSAVSILSLKQLISASNLSDLMRYNCVTKPSQNVVGCQHVIWYAEFKTHGNKFTNHKTCYQRNRMQIQRRNIYHKIG